MKRFNATPEQKERAARRRESFKAIAHQIAEMSEDQRAALAQTCPVVTIEGRALSVHNQCLVALQNPAATIVGGFRQWLKAGRCVAKGSVGLMIWCPTGNKNETETSSAAPSVGALVVSGHNFDAPEKGARPGFIMGTVFDVSQTVELTANAPAENPENAPQLSFVLA